MQAERFPPIAWPGRAVRNAGSGTSRGKEKAATHDPQRTTNRLMQSGVAGQPFARTNVLSADRTVDVLWA
jgi:hypothetical protein